MKVLRAMLSGLVMFATVTILVIAITYARCLIEGIPYNLSIVAPIAMKTASVPGVAIFILTLIGGPRRRPPF